MSMALTAPPTRKRFLIVACLFIGIFIAYLDRVNVSVLAANEPFLAYMGIEGMPLQIGMMMTVFLAAYGIANVVLSPLGDYLGPRKAMMLCILIWTIALIDWRSRYIIRSNYYLPYITGHRRGILLSTAKRIY